MRSIVWLLLLSVAAVVAAIALGGNDGLVTIYWLGWRTDVSLNFFLLALALTFLAVHSLVQGLDRLLALPERAKRWRLANREKAAQGSLREALALYLAGRYTRAHKSAQRAIAIQADTPGTDLDAEFSALANLLSAGSLHRLQDRQRRDEHLQRALDLSKLTRKPRVTEEGARLLKAECALGDNDATRAMEELSELPPGVARRTQALRLKLQAARLKRQPLEALKTARLLAKHQGFTAAAAEGLLRTLATESFDTARDADQLRQVWAQLDPIDRRDPIVVAAAASKIARLGAPTEARNWLAPFWDQLPKLPPETVDALAQALSDSLLGMEAEWLPRLDAATQTALRHPGLALALGLALAERQLWGKARSMLLSAANDLDLDLDRRRQAWAKLGQLAEREQRHDEAARFFRLAALATPD